jgi:hypothetical protein
MLNLLLLLLISIAFRNKLPSKHYLWVVVGLLCYFAAITVLLPMLSDGGHEGMPGLRAPAAAERLMAWKMFLAASLQHPLWGFGWGQLASAHFLVAADYPGQAGLFTQSHNLLLDLILWNGYPIGLALIAILAWWGWKLVSSIRTFEHLHGLAFVTVLGTHAMLEFPLQYAVFLLPFGLIAGSLHTQLGFQPLWKEKKWIALGLTLVVAIMLSITIRDYFRSETSLYGLRFQHYKIQTTIPAAPPDVMVLTQFHDSIAFSRNTPQKDLKPEELQWMSDTVNALPSPLTIYKLAANLAMNNQPEEAELWLVRLCRTTAEISCKDMHQAWLQNTASHPEMMAIKWPK